MAEQTCDLLIEIGTEELPPKALADLAAGLEKQLLITLVKAELSFADTHRYATPRRLAVLIHDLSVQQPGRRLERRGPAVQAAYDDTGKPTKAALGFARSCGVEIDELQILETDKGTWLVYVRTEPGMSTATLLPALLDTVLQNLPIPKYMRWGTGEAQFVRPVHWVILLFGDQVIPATILGVVADRKTYGHRFHHPDPLFIGSPNDYQTLLETEGKVIPDFDKRRRLIQAQLKDRAAEIGGRVIINNDLLNEVTALVEWPVALTGNFDPGFLEVPAEALISTLQGNQKCFPVLDTSDRLLPHFIAVSNVESREPAQVKAGFERVIRPRFSDAKFFWDQDRKQSLASRLEALKGVVFQQQLGSLYDKSQRVAELSRWIAETLRAHANSAERAAWLAKCDLLTEMVQEFPDLQGIMGRYYALHDGESEEVARAIEEHYRPRFAGDQLPQSRTGQIVALADRLDSLIGIFAIGQAPSGAKDPFALRRAALGVVRISIEGDLDLDLMELLENAAKRLAFLSDPTVDSVFDFIMERLRGYYAEHDFRPDEFEAVLECRPKRLLDFDKRLRAVAEFRRLPEAESLTAANKRIRNILRRAEEETPSQVDPKLFQENAESILTQHLKKVSAETAPLLNAGLYREALGRIAELRQSVDNFFDQVMVMTEDPLLRGNRLALLKKLSDLFLRVADFSRLQN